MTQPQLLLAVLLVQQGFFALTWMGAAYLRLARRAALHWALATTLVAVAMGLILLRMEFGPWLSLALPNILIILGVAALRRGVQCFFRLKPTDREQALVVALDSSALLSIVAAGAPTRLVAIVGSAAVALLFLRMAEEMYRGMRAESGRLTAWLCSAPTLVIGLLFAVRAVVTWVRGPAAEGSLSVESSANVITSFAMMVFGLIVNAQMVAITIIRLITRLRYQSEHDPLTNLLNRRAMQRLIDDESRRQIRYGGSFALLSVDVDHFKRVNDHFGHGVGDEVLKRVAEVMRHNCRETDRLARMGGEEFWVLLTGSRAEAAVALGERLLAAVRELDLGDVATGLRVTISIGHADARPQTEPLELLLRRLDVALYAAKSGGRDRLVQAEPAF